MRFSAPTLLVSSPIRTSPNTSRSTFRAPSDSSDSDEYSYEESSDSDEGELESSSGTSSEEPSESESESESEESNSPRETEISRHRRIAQEEERDIEETVTAIRVRTRHKDPYEEWERQTRKDAFHTARKQQASSRSEFRDNQGHSRVRDDQRLRAACERDLEEVRQRLRDLDTRRLQEEQKVVEVFKRRERVLKDRIDNAIKIEEDKLRERVEAERRRREEEERKRAAEAARAAEKKRQEEERKRKEDEERQRKADEERLRKEDEARVAEAQELERKMKEQEDNADSIRETAGAPRADMLWLAGLRTLQRLKGETMRAVKGPKPPSPLPDNYQAPLAPPLKKLWSAQRRKITPKVGQLTDDPQQIARITEELKVIVAPIQGTPEALHHALLSSVAKIIIRQAETEVTAHKEQAVPLAQLAVNLLCAYPLLGDIFWAKLCELAGCWIVPIVANERDVQEVTPGQTSEKQYMKLWSRREDESQDTQVMRITGVLRLYMHMLFVPVPHPLPPQFRPARFWSYLSQLLSNTTLLQRVVAPEAIYVALDVGGVRAKAIWGKQWIKMLAFIYESVQGEGKERIGGTDPAAQASRVRCQLDIEKIMAANS